MNLRYCSILSAFSAIALGVGGDITPAWADAGSASLSTDCSLASPDYTGILSDQPCLPQSALDSAAAWAAGSAMENRILGTRPSLSLEEALLGTWSADNGRRLYYFAPGQVTIVTQLNSSSPPITQVLSYEVLGVDETTGMLRLKIETPLNWAEVRTLRFAADRQGVLEQLSIVGQDLSSEWIYAGQAQTP